MIGAAQGVDISSTRGVVADRSFDIYLCKVKREREKEIQLRAITRSATRSAFQSKHSELIYPHPPAAAAAVFEVSLMLMSVFVLTL